MHPSLRFGLRPTPYTCTLRKPAGAPEHENHARHGTGCTVRPQTHAESRGQRAPQRARDTRRVPAIPACSRWVRPAFPTHIPQAAGHPGGLFELGQMF